jgi:uncharacterized damage-inducible protein DinB
MTTRTEDHLQAIIGHHVWATIRLIDLCGELSPEQLELSLPGTYGSIHATLDHMVAGDYRYQIRMTGGEPGPPPDWPPRPLTRLRAEMDRQARRWRELLERIEELDAEMPAEDGPEPYPRIEHAVGLFITQAVHHGNEHRAHVLSVLGAHGLEAPELSGWEYFRFLEESKKGADPA